MNTNIKVIHMYSYYSLLYVSTVFICTFKTYDFVMGTVSYIIILFIRIFKKCFKISKKKNNPPLSLLTTTWRHYTGDPSHWCFFLAEMMVQEVDGLSRTHYCFLKRNASMLDTAMAGDSNQDLVCSLMFHSLQNGISWSLRNWSYSVTASLKRRKWSTDWRDSLSLSLFSSPSCRQASCVSFYMCAYVYVCWHCGCVCLLGRVICCWCLSHALQTGCQQQLLLPTALEWGQCSLWPVGSAHPDVPVLWGTGVLCPRAPFRAAGTPALGGTAG